MNNELRRLYEEEREDTRYLASSECEQRRI